MNNLFRESIGFSCGQGRTQDHFPGVIQNSQTLQGYMFRALHHFATKLGNSTNFRMIFVTVVKDFDRLA